MRLSAPGALKLKIVIIAFLFVALALSAIQTWSWTHKYSHDIFGNYHSYGVGQVYAAASVSTVKSGDWSDPSTWSGGNAPGAADSVAIVGGHTVTYDLTDSQVSGVTIADNAKLIFSPAKTALLRTNKNILLLGELEMKPSSDTVHHTIRFVNVVESNFLGGGMNVLDSDIGLWVRGDGVLDIAGTAKTSWTNLQSGANAGSTSVTLQSAPSGWRVGDEISIVPTEPPSAGDPSWSGFEIRTIKAVSGNVITLNTSLSRSHPAVTDPNTGKTFTPEVLNLSRNVHIEGTGDGSEDPARNGRAHIQVLSTAPQFVSYAELRLLGPRRPAIFGFTESVLGRYPLHFHHSRDGSRGSLVEGTVVRQSGSRAFVPHASHGITFRGTIAYDVWDDAYWWDPPAPNTLTTFQKFDTTNNSEDTLFDRSVAAIVKSDPSFRGFRLAGFVLGAGSGNEIRDSVAVGIQGNADASGFSWPESANENVGGNVWTFNNGNIAHNNKVHGIFTWQNDGNNHIIQNFVAYHNGAEAIDHGAYSNNYQYIDIVAFGNGMHGLEVHVSAPSKDIGRVDGYSLAFERYTSTEPLLFPKHVANAAFPTLFKDCVFSQVMVNDKDDNGTNPTKADFVNCRKPGGLSLEPSDFALHQVVPGLDVRVQRPDGTAYRIQDGGVVSTIAPFYTTTPAPPAPTATPTPPAPTATPAPPAPTATPAPPAPTATPAPPAPTATPTPPTPTATPTPPAPTATPAPPVPTPEPPEDEDTPDDAPAGLITNVQTLNSNPYEVGNLDVGQMAYTDRTYTFTGVPSDLMGAEYIRTANNDKRQTANNFLSFDLTADATVYVAYDHRVITPPSWLDSSWTLQSDMIGTSDVSRRLYQKDFPAGSVQLGGNATPPMKGAYSNYNVIVIPGGTL